MLFRNYYYYYFSVHVLRTTGHGKRTWRKCHVTFVPDSRCRISVCIKSLIESDNGTSDGVCVLLFTGIRHDLNNHHNVSPGQEKQNGKKKCGNGLKNIMGPAADDVS